MRKQANTVTIEYSVEQPLTPRSLFDKPTVPMGSRTAKDTAVHVRNCGDHSYRGRPARQLPSANHLGALAGGTPAVHIQDTATAENVLSFLPPRGSARTGIFLWLIPAALFGLIIYQLISAIKSGTMRPPKAPAVSSGPFPRTLLEDNGHQVLIPAKPMRIIAGNAGAADVLVALVEPARMAGMSSTVDQYGGEKEFYARHQEIPRFEKYQAEIIMALNPDLILASSFQDMATTSFLEQHHIPILTIANYRTFEGIRGFILAAGCAVGEDQKALALVGDFDRRLETVRKAVAGRKRPRVLCYSNFGMGLAVGSGESQDEILRHAGADNAAAEMQLVGHVNFTFEQMLKLKPDYLAVSGDSGFDSPQVKILMNEPALAELSVIKNGRIVVVPDKYFSSISQYVVNAVEILARQLHPDAFDLTTAPPGKKRLLGGQTTP